MGGEVAPVHPRPRGVHLIPYRDQEGRAITILSAAETLAAQVGMVRVRLN